MFFSFSVTPFGQSRRYNLLRISKYDSDFVYDVFIQKKMYSLKHVIGTVMSLDVVTCPVQIVRDKLCSANVQSSAVQSTLNDPFII